MFAAKIRHFRFLTKLWNVNTFTECSITKYILSLIYEIEVLCIYVLD